MSQISITINGRDYSIVCDDGQEQHQSIGPRQDRQTEDSSETYPKPERILLKTAVTLVDHEDCQAPERHGKRRFHTLQRDRQLARVQQPRESHEVTDIRSAQPPEASRDQQASDRMCGQQYQHSGPHECQWMGL